MEPLELFDPAIKTWFEKTFEQPSPIQKLAWPSIAAGEHVLLSAPTGSGKTLTAFLWAINQLTTGAWPHGELSVLYVSPLKALNNDIRVNLTEPLAGIQATLAASGRQPAEVIVRTRSGDTPSAERQKMVRHPPEILITTPESLNLILSSVRARYMLRTVRTVILDEIHAVVDGKRGSQLIAGVERIVGLAGEFQRIAISATVTPIELVARFIGGARRVGDGYENRKVTPIQAPRSKRLELSVRFPGQGQTETDDRPSTWPGLIDELRGVIRRNRSTLIFVNTRRHAEKITELLNEESDTPVAYAHHGSLSREIRAFVEESLRKGTLRAIVATNSLELGIDVGQLDEVVMVETPMSVSSTLQRVGRAGHQVDATSTGTLYPLYGKDAIDAAVAARATLEENLESATPPVSPLDVLAQQIISMTGVETWDIDELYAEIKCSWPYRDLERRTYDLVIEMLAGRYAATRIRDLKPRISVDRINNTVKAREGSLMVLYQSGGTIPDRGYYGLRLAGGGGRIGELDEEFVWERTVGDTFYLGSQLWTISGIGERDVEVVPGNPGAHIVPFWKAEARGRATHFAGLALEFLEECENAIGSGTLPQLLESRPELEESTRSAITDALLAQRSATRTALPHRHHIVVETYIRPAGVGRKRAGPATDSQEIVIHCPWGMGVTQPLAFVLAGIWDEENHLDLQVFANDSCLALLLPPEFDSLDVLGPESARKLLKTGRIEELLRRKLEHSGLFGAMFRENAGRALMLPRGGFDRRMPLWLNRLRSKKLLGAIQEYDDFPILIETWRECLNDRFDLAALRLLLTEISTGTIVVSTCNTGVPSPFAGDVLWRQTNLYMYLDDSRPGGSGSALNRDLLREAAETASLRPEIPTGLITELERRLQRIETGYAPGTAAELVDWVSERVFVPEPECGDLAEAMNSEGVVIDPRDEVTRRLCWITPGESRTPLLTCIEQLGMARSIWPRITVSNVCSVDPETWWVPTTATARSDWIERFLADPGPDAESVVSQWLRFYGPRTASWITDTLGIGDELGAEILDQLVTDRTVISGFITSGGAGADQEGKTGNPPELCDAENLEHLLALLRRSHRPVFEPVDSDSLVGLVASLTGMIGNHSDEGDSSRLVSALESLFFYPAPARAWESDLIPSRVPGYFPLWLDGLFKESELIWFGCGNERLAFSLHSDHSVLASSPDAAEASSTDAAETSSPDAPTKLRTFLDDLRAADFWSISRETGLGSRELTAELWKEVWRGAISNDSFETVRKGLASRFAAEATTRQDPNRGWPGRRTRSGSRGSWSASRPLSGNWFKLAGPDESDPLSDLENEKERARVLLARYGVLYRELLDRELPEFRWRKVFRALRLMELSGEVVAGAFINGIVGVQFATRQALDMLSGAPPEIGIFWMSAVDPASPCGLPSAAAFPDLPSRIPGNHLVFRDRDLVVVSRRNGADITFSVSPEDPDIPLMIEPLKNMVSRRWEPRPRVVVETINGDDARESPFATGLLDAGFRRDHKSLVLSAGYR